MSLDWADPPESWRWAGPAWRGGAPSATAGGITSLTLAAVEPAKMAARWSEVLGDGAQLDGTSVYLEAARQELRFEPTSDAKREGIVGCGLALPDRGSREPSDLDIGGVRFTVTRA